MGKKSKQEQEQAVMEVEEETQQVEKKEKKEKKAKKEKRKREEEEAEDVNGAGESQHKDKKRKGEEAEQEVEKKDKKKKEKKQEEVVEVVSEKKEKKEKKKKEKRSQEEEEEKKEDESASARHSAHSNIKVVNKDESELEVTVEGIDNPPAPFNSFSECPMPDILKREIDSLGFTRPTKIQSYSWPLSTIGRDLVAIAETGSGKTLAFLVPALIKLLALSSSERKKGPSILVLAPTRELALQIREVTNTVCTDVGVKSACVYGGDPKGPQIQELKKAEIVVATPGRLIDLIQDGASTLGYVKFLVLDEADRMLDMGFEPQIRRIINQIPSDRQTVMFSATWPFEVQKLARDFLTNPCQITIGSKDLSANSRVTQEIKICEEHQKKRLLDGYLQQWMPHRQRGSTAKGDKDVKLLLFMLYKKKCDSLFDQLSREGWPVAIIHGDKSQPARIQAVEDFKSGKCPILIATDVAARGLDIPNVQYVLNYEFPLLCEDWVHRVGRTGRAGKTGTAITFFTKNEMQFARELRSILISSGQPISPEFDALCDKAPAATIRKSNASKMYGGAVSLGQSLEKATRVVFNDSDDE